MANHHHHLPAKLAGGMERLGIGSSSNEPQTPWLHGMLRVSVLRANGISNGDSSMVGLMARVVTDASATFCEVKAGPRMLLKTGTAKSGDRNPEWNETGVVEVADRVETIECTIFASAAVKVGRIVKPLTLGECEVDVATLVRQQVLRTDFVLRSKHRKAGAGVLTIHFEYTPLAEVMAQATHYLNVPSSYFPMRRSCMVTMYQDAHTVPGMLPRVFDHRGVDYAQRPAWQEMYQAMANAKKLIYVAGWSVVTDIVMIRDGRGGDGDGDERPVSVGELLKRKAEEGVTVSVLIWDEVLSQSKLNGLVQTQGLMGTQDEETFAFFKGTKVHCAKLSRDDDGTNGLLGGLQTAGLWTHHIKHVIVDRSFPSDPVRRRLCCYMGGLDLTIGRFDTPRHDLFRTLQTTHKDDFWQGCVLGADVTTGSREPWHDVHCCVEGAIAWDCERTFVDRWRRQAPAESHVACRRILQEEFVSGEEESRLLDSNPDRFDVQFFRSMDERSVMYDQPPIGAATASLSSKKGRTVEAGIVRAYIHHIRKAERFIYIENQYVLGGSSMWDKPSTISDNLIPIEIAAKICSKIEARQEFCVYIILPMMPEGSQYVAVNEILRWQYKTAWTMYKEIASCIRRCGLTGQVAPTDYLSYFCLGNRESVVGSQATSNPDPASSAYAGWLHRRNMIYVHSKLMIVDDVVMIQGSANINSRSMAGTRDTEIAIAAAQPLHTLHTAAQGGLGAPRGAVHCFRMSLWGEHLGELSQVLVAPWSSSCMRYMREKGLQNWISYTAPSTHGNVDIKGHLLLYPYVVDAGGSITGRTETLPDFPKVKVVGQSAIVLPDIGTG